MGLNAQAPGLHPARLLRLTQQAVARCDLNLVGATVLTEAATGAYVVTPVLAALAGAAQVFALARATRYGAIAEVVAGTQRLAALAGVADRVTILSAKHQNVVSRADIITNSGHLRPLDATTIGWMQPYAVIPLMYEAWEFRAEDVDLAACRALDIPVAGTNERHPAVDVFSYLGIMAVKALLDSGVAVAGSRLLVLCDNPFGPFIINGLQGAGAQVHRVSRLEDAGPSGGYDAVIVALQPSEHPALGDAEAQLLAKLCPGAVVVQFWGDIDRTALAAHDLPYWPFEAPPSGHMGVLPSQVGPEPVVRLQAGGLKVGELLWKERRRGASVAAAIEAAEASGFGMHITQNLET